jgi:Domain of unknown function (DUF4349)
MNTDVAYLSQLQNDLLAAAERGTRRRASSRRPAVAAAVLGGLILAAVVGSVVPRLTGRSAQDSSLSAIQSSGSVAAGSKNQSARTQLNPRLAITAPSPAQGAGATGSLGGLDAAGSRAVVPPSTVPVFGPKIVKTARMDLQVANGTFERAFGDASAVAAANGGFVVSSSSGGVGARYGTLVLQVPSDRFEAALQSLRSIGIVKWQSVNGRDVTAAYIDLTARIRTWRSQEAVLFRLMGRATTIGETLQIQSQLQRVQLTIEELQGQLRLLRSQSANGTISLSIRETGVRSLTTNGPAAVAPTMLRAWRSAVGGFLGVVAAIVIGLGYLIPIALVCLAGWILTRRVRRLASA